MVGKQLGAYEILAPLGAGGMGEVYRARDTKLGREVAIKILPPAFAGDAERLARFQREAQVLASLNHPNIASIYGLEDFGGAPALVMELVEGPTLADRIAAGPLPLEEALGIARQIAEAVEAAHEKGIIHRDLKPANVKITPGGMVKVLDFGLAKALDDDRAGSDLRNSPTISLAATRAGVILGTAAYMSPEQAKGKSVDRRADIWSFGVVLLEMLTGRQVYAGETAAETLAAVMLKDASLDGLPPGTPAPLRKLLRRCLDKDARRRLQAIGEARVVIDDLLTGAPVEETPPLPEVPAPAPRSVLWPLAGGLLVTSILALVFGTLYFRQPASSERVLRYSVAPPEKSNIHTFAISPDGRYLAIAASAEGKRRLWVRALDALDPQLLSGTDDAMYPFWSSDSRQIGFFAQGKMRKIAINGGPATTLCDAADGRGGTWNREGIIVFAPQPGKPLHRVSGAGGVPIQVNRPEDGANSRFPVYLPDGRRFLYVVSQAKDPEKNGIWVGYVDSMEGRRVLADMSSTLFVPAQVGAPFGHLLFLREGTLVAQPVETKSLQPAGELFPVAEGVPFGLHNNFAPISLSDNGTLVYLTGRNALESQLTWFDRGGKPLGPAGAPGRIGTFAISPDGKRVALTRVEDKAQDLWLYETERGTESRFTFHASRNLAPVWSPDGSRIAFASDRRGQFDVFQKASSGAGQEEPLVESPVMEAPTHWSRDGRFLVLNAFHPKTNWDLSVLPLEGDRKPVPFLATEFHETQGQLSPDGKWISYTSNESGRWEVYVQAFPKGSGPEGKWKISTAGGEGALWRRDGNGKLTLFYLDAGMRLNAVPVKTAGPKSAFEVGAPESLFETRLRATASIPLGWDYDVTADAKRFLVRSSRDQSTQPPLVVVTNWQAGVRR